MLPLPDAGAVLEAEDSARDAVREGAVDAAVELARAGRACRRSSGGVGGLGSREGGYGEGDESALWGLCGEEYVGEGLGMREGGYFWLSGVSGVSGF